MNASKTEDTTNSSRDDEFKVQFEDQMLQPRGLLLHGFSLEKKGETKLFGNPDTHNGYTVGPQHRCSVSGTNRPKTRDLLCCDTKGLNDCSR